MRLGFIGLGAMGSPMAHHLIDAGHQLTVYARRPQAAAEFTAKGAGVAASSAALARECEVIFTNVTLTRDVEEVVLGDAGIIQGAAPGSIVIDMGTISAQATRAIAARLAEKAIEMLDAPVSGGTKGAQAASLSIMVGGKEAVFDRARGLLACLGKTIVYAGDHGAGQVTKHCNQIVQVVNIQGICEAFLYAHKNGVDLHKVLAALSAGFAGSKMLDLEGPKLAAREFAAGIEARLHHKDFATIVAAAQDLGLTMPATALVAQQLNGVMGNGWGAMDTASLLRVLERASGLGD